MGELNKVLAVPHNAVPATSVHVPLTQSGKVRSGLREEEEKIGKRSRESQRIVFTGSQRLGVAMEGSQLLLFLILFCCHKNGDGEGDGGKFDSPRGGEQSAAKRGQFNNEGKISVTAWRRVAVTGRRGAPGNFFKL